MYGVSFLSAMIATQIYDFSEMTYNPTVDLLHTLHREVRTPQQRSRNVLDKKKTLHELKQRNNKVIKKE